MLPVLLSICSLHRIMMFASLDRKATDFDFTKTIQKLRDVQSSVSEGSAAEPYDLLQDKEQVTSVMGEISAKGLIPFEYQLDFFNFLIFWYFFASFLISSFALLYYRKYRES
mmetsp:Transcript_25263/g.31631  ORF Transcript_25263/g.31631 Transcript_25263/m.31631 type:complete len:112 (-) Transcript_25263:18-353(-)